MSKQIAAITSDIDSLESIYKGQGCYRAQGYTHAEIRMGLETFSRFLEPYRAKTTLFMVGNDFRYAENHDAIRAVAAEGHEIANHTMTHAQGFRLLSAVEKEKELDGMEKACEHVTGKRPVGFRSPGWNIGDDAIPILRRRGYLYDSSIHPTSIMPLLKLMHWSTMRERSASDRTTMGHIKYMFAPTHPYRTSLRSFSERGRDGILEFPVTVTPILRLPFFATFLVSTGLGLFQASLRELKRFKYPLQFQFHLSDFVDYSHSDLSDQVPQVGHGQYVPAALNMTLDKKISLFKPAVDALAADFEFITLEQWASSTVQV